MRFWLVKWRPHLFKKQTVRSIILKVTLYHGDSEKQRGMPGQAGTYRISNLLHTICYRLVHAVSLCGLKGIHSLFILLPKPLCTEDAASEPAERNRRDELRYHNHERYHQRWHPKRRGCDSSGTKIRQIGRKSTNEKQKENDLRYVPELLAYAMRGV